MQKLGKTLKELRLKRDLSLREICRKSGYDPSNWSKVERGLMPPPTDGKTLIKWAKAVKLKNREKKRIYG